MEPQEILAHPSQAIISRWNSVEQCPCAEQVYEITAAIKQTKPEIKRLKKDKQKLSRQFSDHSLSANDLASLKDKIGAISSKIKYSELALKRHLAELSKLFAHDPIQPEVPPRFATQKKQGDNKKIDLASVTVKVADRSLAAQWDAYVSANPIATPYHRFGWQSVIENAHRVAGIYLIALQDDGLCVGVLPLFNLRSKLFGNYLISMPYFNYGGPLADSLAVERLLLDQAAKACQEVGSEHVEIRSLHTINKWAQKTDKVSMLLSLPKTQELLDTQLGAKLRAQIKRSRKQPDEHDFQIRFGHIELLNDFYSVFSRNMRDLGTPVYARRFFAEILSSFKKETAIAVVYDNSKPVATGFLLGDKETLEITWASTLRSHNQFNTNMLLYREILGYAIDNGFRYFDFGRSTVDAPTYRFKKQWGAKPIQHHWHYWLSEGNTMPELNPNNPKYKLAVRVWKIMPVWLTKIIGPPIVKNLP